MIDVLLTSVSGVIFPVFSRVQTETARLREAYLSATRMAAFITFPTFAFVIVTAPQIIDVAFGSKWQQSVPVMQILCLVGPIWAVAQFNNAVLMATGHARFVFYMNLAGTILQVIGFFIAVRFGILWVAAAYVIRAYVGAPIALVRAARLLDSPFSGYVRELCPATVASVVMVACVMGTQALLDGQVPQALELVVLGGVALGAYMAAMRAASASHFAEAMHYARAVRPRLHGARAA
jgi:PST family polysaccharide transporter